LRIFALGRQQQTKFQHNHAEPTTTSKAVAGSKLQLWLKRRMYRACWWWNVPGRTLMRPVHFVLVHLCLPQKRTPPSNLLLAALPSADYARLRPHLTKVRLKQKAVLQEPQSPIEHIYFPLDGMISLVALLKTGDEIEIAASAPACNGSSPCPTSLNTSGGLPCSIRRRSPSGATLTSAPLHRSISRHPNGQGGDRRSHH
jgi:hypothetical protein